MQQNLRGCNRTGREERQTWLPHDNHAACVWRGRLARLEAAGHKHSASHHSRARRLCQLKPQSRKHINWEHTTQDASAAYIIATATLIRRPGDAEGAAAAADVWAKENACQEVRAATWRSLTQNPKP